MQTTDWATITLEGAKLLHAGCRYQHPDWEEGSTEPWVIDVVASLLLASGSRRVLELGGYKGACSRVLAQTIARMGGGTLGVVEYNPEFIPILEDRLRSVEAPGVAVQIYPMDALEALKLLPERSVEFAWVDDSHDTPHVVEEMELLIPRMVDGGIICFHDVFGHYSLRDVVAGYGGYSLDLLRVSSSGGLGILQVTPITRTFQTRVVPYGEPLSDKVLSRTLLTAYGGGDDPIHYVPAKAG